MSIAAPPLPVALLNLIPTLGRGALMKNLERTRSKLEFSCFRAHTFTPILSTHGFHSLSGHLNTHRVSKKKKEKKNLKCQHTNQKREREKKKGSLHKCDTVLLNRSTRLLATGVEQAGGPNDMKEQKNGALGIISWELLSLSASGAAGRETRGGGQLT